jgi:AcrR family transcriptional regulator
MESGAEAPTDGRLRRGDDTRRAVLAKAVETASLHGLEGLSIGGLATELGISKSGLFAHFGSKEELQLATVRAARRIYSEVVVEPALRVPPGTGRLWALCEAWIRYSRDRVFPGGCFFSKATHEFAARPGAVLDSLADSDSRWMTLLRQTIDDARLLGQLRSDVDGRQLAFELTAAFEQANLRSILGDDDAYRAATVLLGSLLDGVAAEGAERPWAG